MWSRESFVGRRKSYGTIRSSPSSADRLVSLRTGASAAAGVFATWTLFGWLGTNLSESCQSHLPAPGAGAGINRGSSRHRSGGHHELRVVGVQDLLRVQLVELA